MRSEESEITVAGSSSGSVKADLTSAVYKINLDCEECANKLQRAVKAFDGVEDCKVDWKANTATVAFGKVDPLKIGQKLEKKTKKKVQLLSTQSGAAAVGGEIKENRTEQKFEERREQEQEQDTVLVLKEEVEVDVKCVCCFPGSLRIKFKAGFAAKREEGGGDKEDNEGRGTRKNGDSVVKTEFPRKLNTPPPTNGHYGGPTYFPSPRWSGYGNRYLYLSRPPSPPTPQYNDDCSIM